MEQKNISADDYILFVAIVEQESMVRAAEHLGMPKATVSRRLGNLEAALGQRLLLRTTRRLTLTEFGQEFLDHCRRVAEEVASTRDFVHSREERPRGRLRVSMPGEYAMQNFSRAFATFIETYPEVQLDLDLTSRRVDLIGERFDLAIRMGTLDSDATLVARKIDEQSFGLYASPIYLALHSAPKRPDELEHHATVRLLSGRGSAVPWKLMRGKAVWEGVPPGRITLNSLDVLQRLLLDGAGIGALPDRFVAEDVKRKRLLRVLPEWCLPAVPAWAVMPMRRYLPAKTRAFVAHLEQFIGKG
ncbi:MAG: Transcriptional regulator, LysR family [Candidatus Gallionella acididurans]|uniref:Transcriptional regulator, LysR family n=1 Tax=Candidatus Gallionella acididurans TaxID=1796491 RepID=A0A139BQM0_9PROT|nr:MAG: Transcriptional regulator, LysR family [Candidatus Gallionella acididurans]